MKREIKFRAWDGKQMYLRAGINFTGTCEVPYSDGEWHTGDRPLLGKEVVLMQFTGLKDKNGKEIYEGDLVKHSDYPSPLFVYFCEDCAGFRLQFPGYGNNELIDPESDEIVGSLYDPPALLSNT